MTRIIVDNCTLVNFAAIGEIKFLRDTLRERGCWTQATAFECRKSVRYYGGLAAVLSEGWLGDPLEFDSDADVRGVQDTWRALGSPLSKPTDNLGEAEAIHGILSRPELRGAIFLTDDNPAADFAQFQHIIVWQTRHVLSEAYASGDVRCPDAYQMLERMRDADRGVYVPMSHRDVCP